MILLTASPRGRRWRRQRFKLWVARRPRWLAQNFVNRRPLALQFKRLDFIHAGTWYEIDRFPILPGVEPENPAHRWVAFSSNFNGTWESYLDTFLDGFGHGIYSLWSSTVGFPYFPGPSARYNLIRWVETRRLKVDHYYAAYPQATCADVRAALRVSRELEHGGLYDRPGRDVDADRTQLIRRLQGCLGESQGPDRGGLPIVLAPDEAHQIVGLMSLAPVLPGAEDRLRASLKALPCGVWDPFRRVAGTHFAQLAMIDRRVSGLHPRSQLPLRNSWLAMVVHFDAVSSSEDERRAGEADVRRYLGQVEAQAHLRRLWGLCQCRDDAPDLVSYLLPTVVFGSVTFTDYGDSSLQDVLTALDDVARLRRSLVRPPAA